MQIFLAALPGGQWSWTRYERYFPKLGHNRVRGGEDYFPKPRNNPLAQVGKPNLSSNFGRAKTVRGDGLGSQRRTRHVAWIPCSCPIQHNFIISKAKRMQVLKSNFITSCLPLNKTVRKGIQHYGTREEKRQCKRKRHMLRDLPNEW